MSDAGALKERIKTLTFALRFAASYLALATVENLMTDANFTPARALAYVMRVLGDEAVPADLAPLIATAQAGHKERDRLTVQAERLHERLKKEADRLWTKRKFAKPGDERERLSDAWHRVDRVRGKAEERMLARRADRRSA